MKKPAKKKGIGRYQSGGEVRVSTRPESYVRQTLPVSMSANDPQKPAGIVPSSMFSKPIDLSAKAKGGKVRKVAKVKRR